MQSGSKDTLKSSFGSLDGKGVRTPETVGTALKTKGNPAKDSLRIIGMKKYD